MRSRVCLVAISLFVTAATTATQNQPALAGGGTEGTMSTSLKVCPGKRWRSGKRSWCRTKPRPCRITSSCFATRRAMTGIMW